MDKNISSLHASLNKFYSACEILLNVLIGHIKYIYHFIFKLLIIINIEMGTYSWKHWLKSSSNLKYMCYSLIFWIIRSIRNTFFFNRKILEAACRSPRYSLSIILSIKCFINIKI